MNDKLKQNCPYNLDDGSARIIVSGTVGSTSQGLSDPDASDEDAMGILQAPLRDILGLKVFERWVDQNKAYDACFYSVRRFCELAVKCNPTATALLWIDDQFIDTRTPEFDALRALRDDLTCKEALKAIVGYAYSQFKQCEHSYNTKKAGPKRQALVDEFGYDTKGAMHGLRMLMLGEGYLKTGTQRVLVDGDDREELLRVRRGAWSFDEVKAAMAWRLDNLDQLSESCGWPERPRTDRIEQWLLDTQADWIISQP